MIARRLAIALFALSLVACNSDGCAVIPVGHLGQSSKFAINLAQASPGSVTASRTGNTLYLQTGATTVAQSSSLSATLYEDRGDGRGGGTWTFPAYANDITAPFTHTAGAGWLLYGAGLSVTNTGTGPDGTTAYDKVNDSSTTDRVQVYISVGTSGTRHMNTEWLRDDSGTPPSAQGALTGNTTAASGTMFGTGTNWRRIVDNQGIDVMHAHMGVGSTVPGPSFVLTATGAYDIWGDQQISGATDWWDDVPLVNGSTGAETLQIASSSLSKILQAGDFDIELSYYVEKPSPLLNVPVSPTYVFYMATPSGDFSLRESGTYTWTFAARGADLLTSTTPYRTTRVGALVKWHVWYKPSIASSGMQLFVDGALDTPSGIATGAATAGSIATPTSFVLGSNGSSGYMAARWVSFSTSTATDFRTPEFLVLGDSIAAYYNTDNTPITSSFIYQSNGDAKTRPGIISLARPSDTLANQTTAYNASIYPGLSSIKAVIIEAGINNVNAGSPAATVISDYQTFVNLAHSKNPSAKVVCTKLTPDKQYSDTLSTGYYTVWQTVNTAITGGGGTPITGCDAVVSTPSDTLNDGAGNLAAAYDSGDHIHPNYDGRQILGTGWYTALHTLGLI
jgi:hypothetical protein